MSRRITLIAVPVLVVGGLLGLAVLDAELMQYVPTADQIRSREDLSPFLVEASSVEGIYGNTDVDSVVFRYTAGVGEDEFWRRVEQQLRGTRWAAVAPEGPVRRFQRVIPPEGQQMCWWVDEVRVRYRPGPRTVVVGWVQADPRRAVSGLSECSEAKFAERAIWPHLRGE